MGLVDGATDSFAFNAFLLKRVRSENSKCRLLDCNQSRARESANTEPFMRIKALEP